jgi:hypothetical protein
MKSYQERLKEAVTKATAKSHMMSQEQKDVANLIVQYSYSGRKIKQKELAMQAKVGKHHKDPDAIDSHESTLRKVRQIVRELRVIYALPIVSNRTGYWIPFTEDEARSFLEKIEREARAHFISSKETYSAMAAVLGVKSEFFTNEQEQLL